jgi:outer membrane biosynthesis protein TonB
MRNDLTACDGSQLANAAPIGRRRRRRTVRGLLALPLALALIAPGATALAVEATTGYSQTTPPPKTETTPAPKTGTSPATKTGTTSEPKQETAPTQTSSAPSKKTQPAKSSSEPTATTASKAKTLPFTGLDLRWITLGGLLLVGMGMSIVVVQRRRHNTGR